MEMGTYKSVRVVKAFQIAAIENGKLQNEAGEWIKPVSEDFFERHSPHVGAWMILYPDGYQSVCPDESFREGYRELDESEDSTDAKEPEATETAEVQETPVEAEAGVSPAAEVAEDTSGVLGGDVLVANSGLSDQTRQGLIAGGFFTVGSFREAVIQKTEEGGSPEDLPGVTEDNVNEITTRLLVKNPPYSAE
ncbi:MAG: hypothetical protein AAFV88_04325 [Planctomycetota bacterium]